MEVSLKGFQCQRCGHQWKPRKAGTPKKCPGCDSSSWQVPRGKGLPPHLEEVFQLYEVPEDQRAEIIRYTLQHQGVAMVLLEAVPELKKVFGNARITLDLHVDPEDGWEELFGVIQVKRGNQGNFARLRQFDRAWFRNVPVHVRTNLNFTVRPTVDQ